MSKKKNRSSSKNKTKNSNLFLGIYIIVIVVLVGFLSYKYGQSSQPTNPKVATTAKKEHNLPKKRTQSPKEKNTISPSKEHNLFSFPTQGLEIPAPCKRENTAVLEYENFKVLFDTKQLIPVWVAYELTEKEVGKKNKKVSRSNNFRPDPRLGTRCATTEDYKHSQYDRGHLAPAGDMSFSQKAMNDCFFLTNIAPQNRNLNKGTWKNLEEDARLWARREKNLFITTGTVASPKAHKIGKHKVAVPEYFYKVLLSVSKNQPKAIGFVFKNKECKDKYFDHAVSVDSVEVLTGLDFFPLLPDSIEERVERNFDISLWK